MVDFTTNAPEIQQPDVNIALGTYQRSGGSFLQGVGDAVSILAKNAISNAPDKTKGTEQKIDPVLYNSMFARIEKNGQTGQTSDLTPGFLKDVRQALARGESPERVSYTVKTLTGQDLLGIATLGQEDQKDQPTERDVALKFLNSVHENYTPDGRYVGDLTDAELRTFAFNTEQRMNDVKAAEDKLKVVQSSDGVNKSDLLRATRATIPGRLQAIDTQIQGLITSHPELFSTEYDANGQARTVVRPETAQRNPEAIASIQDSILQMRRQAREQIIRDGLGYYTSEQVNQLNDSFDMYFNELDRIVTGKGAVENLKAISEWQDLSKTSQFFQDNPLALDGIIVAREMGRVVQSLGLEGLTIKDDLAQTLFVPIMTGTVANFALRAREAGIYNEQTQIDLIERMSDYITNQLGDLTTKGAALKLVIPSLVGASKDNPAMFDAMRRMMADPKGAQLVLDALTSVNSPVQVEDLVVALANANDSYREATLAELSKDTTKALELPKKRIQNINELPPDQRELARMFGAPAVQQQTLRDFLNDNLFQEGDLNTDALNELSPAEQKVVQEAYINIYKKYENRFKEMQAVNTNLGIISQRLKPQPPRDQTAK